MVLKLWQARDSFDPERLLREFEEGREFDWNDLSQLVRRTITIDRDRITADCVRAFRFLLDLTEEERILAADPHQRERELWERLSQGVLCGNAAEGGSTRESAHSTQSQAARGPGTRPNSTLSLSVARIS